MGEAVATAARRCRRDAADQARPPRHALENAAALCTARHAARYARMQCTMHVATRCSSLRDSHSLELTMLLREMLERRWVVARAANMGGTIYAIVAGSSKSYERVRGCWGLLGRRGKEGGQGWES